MTDITATTQFSVGKVLATSAAILGRNIVPFGVLALILTVPTVLIQLFLNPAFNIGDVSQVETIGSTYFTYTGPLYLVSVITNGLVTAAMVYGSFQDLRGHKASLGACISRGFTALPLVVIAAIGYSILIALGTLLLIIPGIMIAIIYWLYTPAIVVEKKGIGAAFTRSGDLTRGKRWHIFGLLLVIIVISTIIELIVGSVVGGVLGASQDLGNVSTFVTVVTIASYIASALCGAYMSVANAVTYYYLRADKEGIDIEDIAKLFD